MFKLYSHNQRGELLLNPTLAEILEQTQPFMIASKPYTAHKRWYYVFAQLFEADEPIFNGMLFLDHNMDMTYFAKRNEKVFRAKLDRVQLPHSFNKFDDLANKYEFTSSIMLQEEFQACGYEFQ